MDKKIAIYIYIFSILFALGTIVFFPKWIVDDAYITFRYAENLANHFQLVYNIDSRPVEGYTGFILPVLIAIAIKIGISPVIAAHSVGIISFIVTGIYLFLLLKKIKVSDIVCSITILIYFFIPVVYTHIFSGLETILFLSIIFIVLYYSLNLLKNNFNNNRSLILFGLFNLFLSLVRPEGLLLSVIINIFLTIFFYIEKKHLLKKYILSIISAFIIPFIIYFLWRWNYYGQLFPNTYYLKSGSYTFEYESYKSFIEFFEKYFALPFIISLFLLLINIDRVWKEIKNNDNDILSKEFMFILLPSLIFTLILLLQYFYTDLLMDFSHRFFISTIPVLLILFAVSLNIGFKNLSYISVSNPLTYKVYIILFICFFSLHFYSIIPDMKDEVKLAIRMKILLDEVHIPTGRYIKEHFNKNSTLLVHADAGAIPYFAKLKTIDFGGLNDDYLSNRKKLSGKQIIDYFFDVNADVLAITSFKKNKLEREEGSLNWESLKEILKDERFKNYALVKIFSSDLWNYYEFVFVKRELFEIIFSGKNK